jgi:arsenic resistance protein ArsH
MKVVIFNGSMEAGTHSIGKLISGFIEEKLRKQKADVKIFDVGKADIPLLHPAKMRNVPPEVKEMCSVLQDADLHFWLAPLYHGSIPGIMKNCLDWLEITSKSSTPYLTDKIVGMVCWADGSHAINGIHTMNVIAHSLRAWTVPYNVPVSTPFLFESDSREKISNYYQDKLNMLVDLTVSRKIELR